jgi:hypothetical protein
MTVEDGSRITCAITIDKRLHIVTEQSIYVALLADDIDPERTNPSIPNTQQKVLSYGSDSQFVGRTLLTAKALFNSHYLPKNIDCNEAIKLSFRLLNDLAAMKDLTTEFASEERTAVTSLEERRRAGLSFVIPSVTNPFARCKDFFQKADHSIQTLLSIVKMFYPRAGKHAFEGFEEMLKHTYGADDPFAGFVLETLPFLQFVRSARNSVEHPKGDCQKIVVRDFFMMSSGELSHPTIEVVHPKSHQPPIEITYLMGLITDQIVDVFETMVAWICSKHVTQFAGCKIELIQLPEEEYMREKHVRYAYGTVTPDGHLALSR